MRIKAQECWEVKLPTAKKRMVAGALVPTLRGTMLAALGRKKRRLVVQILGDDEDDDGGEQLTLQDYATTLQERDRIKIRILKPKRQRWGGKDEDSSDDDDDDDAVLVNEDGNGDGDGDFVEYRKYELEEIVNEAVKGNEFEATFGSGSATEVREIFFDKSDAAQDFYDHIQRLKRLLHERASRRLLAFQEQQRKRTHADADAVLTTPGVTNDNDDNGSIDLLVEIVSAVNLPIADRKSSDPYVKVFFGQTEVHRTKPISKSINPIWTIDNGSLFLLSYSARDFFTEAAGLTFVVSDHDGFSSNETLGKLILPQQELVKLHGDRVEYKLESVLKGAPSKSVFAHPKLILRVRKATLADVKFMKQLNASKKKPPSAVYLKDSFAKPRSRAASILKRESKTGSDGSKLYRIKPCPDPARPEQETKWMTKEQIDSEHLKPSTNWMETGSGTLGRVYLEVLHCDGLPNKDKGIACNNKSDAFCSIIYEDAIVSTDVINDELSPRWMPWTQRAFCFKVQHPSSQILLGVLDFDSEKGLNEHDAMGRVSINVTNFRANTSYVLTYKLFKSVLKEDRRLQGMVTIRLCMEWNSYRKMILSTSLKPPPLHYINVAHKNDFRTAFFVCNGDEKLATLNMEAIKSYSNELSSYASVSYHIVDAIVVVLLWRGHYQMNMCGFKLNLPLHSIVAFSMGITLIENLNLLPSYALISVAWFMLATNEHRQRHPSPWNGSMTFAQMWFALLAGTPPPEHISDHENEAAIRLHAEMEEKHKVQQAADKERREEEAKKLSQFVTNDDEEEIEAVDSDLSTKVGGGAPLALLPLKPILLPIQMTLAMICRTLRIVRSIVVWDESVYAFMLTNLCLAAAVALVWVPWDFLLRWTGRIVLWLVLGPWMKLVDVFYIRKMGGNKANDDGKQFQSLVEDRLVQAAASKRTVMMTKEALMKTMALKRYMFGKYATRVPQFKEYRFPDVAQYEYSTATPCSPPKIVIAEKKLGQHLLGTMIPTWADEE